MRNGIDMVINDLVLESVSDYLRETAGLDENLSQEVKRQISLSIVERQSGMGTPSLERFTCELQDKVKEPLLSHVLEVMSFVISTGTSRPKQVNIATALKNRLGQIFEGLYHLSNGKSVAELIVEISQGRNYRDITPVKQLIRGTRLPFTYQGVVLQFVEFLLRFCHAVFNFGLFNFGLT